MANPLIWLTWENQIRNRTLSSSLSAQLFEIVIKGNRALRYLKSAARTLAIIRRTRPRYIVAQNPSIVLGYFLLILRPVYSFALISDSHYVGVEAANGSRLLQRLLDFYNSRVDLTIVTNENHGRYIRSVGGRPFVCQDPLPSIPDHGGTLDLHREKAVFLICSFDRDEPYENVFKAFEQRLSAQGYRLYVSGNFRKAEIDVSRYPTVRFLGYVSTADYFAYLKQADVIVDLTEVDNCLVCGAYESMAARKALVTSDTSALREYFEDAAVYTDHAPENIAKSIAYAFENREKILKNVDRWKAVKNQEMSRKIDALKSLVFSLK
jgi:glycosyltransferase involved in cell wall biosynthesis